MLKTIKKILALCCACVLLLVATVSGTLAFEVLSPLDWAIQAAQNNEELEIRLVQQQRAYDVDGNVTGLIPWDNRNLLVPLTTSAEYDGTNFDSYGLPTAEGYVDRILRIENTGTVDAYVRLIVAIPAALDNGETPALHWSLGNHFMADGSFRADNTENPGFAQITWEHTKTAKVSGVLCNLYTFTYEEPLPAGAITQAAPFVGFYLDPQVNIADGRLLLDGEDTGFTEDTVAIAVRAQAVQAYGFDSAKWAFTAAGVSNNPWKADKSTALTETQKGGDGV